MKRLRQRKAYIMDNIFWWQQPLWMVNVSVSTYRSFQVMKLLELGDFEKFILEQKYEREDGYFLEVDLEYPEELHDKHDAYSLAPEKLKIEEKFLSYHRKTP